MWVTPYEGLEWRSYMFFERGHIGGGLDVTKVEVVYY